MFDELNRAIVEEFGEVMSYIQTGAQEFVINGRVENADEPASGEPGGVLTTEGWLFIQVLDLPGITPAVGDAVVLTERGITVNIVQPPMRDDSGGYVMRFAEP